MMPMPEQAERPLAACAGAPAHWESALLPLAVGVLLLIYHSTVNELVSTWTNSATFAHGMLIPPVSLWLIWRQRAEWQSLALRPAPVMLIPLALAGLGWLLATLGSVPVAQQFCLFAMLIVLLILLQGLARSRAQAFPLLYLLLAVPCGEFLITPLIDLTTAMTVGALRVMGVPVLRENNFLSLPSGNWSVMDACSGLRYLIASIAVGSLYAYLSFRSLQRRLIFMLAAILLPMLANGLRAVGIVLLGHYSNMRWATGVDHLLYGWLFFGLLLGLLLRGGAYWREPAPAKPATPPMPATLITRSGLSTSATAAALRLRRVLLLAALVMMSLWPLLAQHLLRAMQSSSAVSVQLAAPPPPWQLGSEAGGFALEVALPGASLWTASYLSKDTRVQLQLLHPLQAASTQSRGSVVQAHWQVLEIQQRSLRIGDRTLPVQQILLRDGPRKLQVWRCYRLADRHFASDWEIRLRQAASLLQGRRAVVTEIRVAAEYSDLDQAPDASMAALLQAMYDAILSELDHAAR